MKQPSTGMIVFQMCMEILYKQKKITARQMTSSENTIPCKGENINGE